MYVYVSMDILHRENLFYEWINQYNSETSLKVWSVTGLEMGKTTLGRYSLFLQTNNLLSNNNHNHNVTVDAMPGARIARMKSTRINKDTDVVIVHAGTCNIKKQTDPEKLADEIVSTLRDIKSSCPRAQVAFSSIIKRNDDLELNAKVIKTNQILEEKLLFSGLDYVNNDNVKYGMISTDGLHVNDGGVRMLASNFSKYIRYC